MATTLIIALTDLGYAAVASRAAAAGLVNIQRVPATPGSAVDLSDRAVVSAEAAYTISTRAQWPACGTANAVGCMLSHIAAWRIAATLPTPTVILEEDAAFFPCAVPAAIAAVTQTYDVLMLGGRLAPSKAGAPPGLYKINGRVFCSEAYVVTPAGAAKLLAGALPVVTQIDAYLGARTLDVAVYALRPPLARQLVHPSTIQVTNTRLSGGSVCAYQSSSFRPIVRAAAAAGAVGSKRARLSSSVQNST